MPVPETITKAELLSAMPKGWTDLWAYLDTLSEAQLTQLMDTGGWRVQDHVIHLAVWEGSMNDLLQKRPRWEAMGVSLATWERGEINAINDEIYQRNKALTRAQVRQQFRQAHEELIGRIETLSEAELQRSYHYYQPSSEAMDTAAHRLGIASYDHYAKHIPWIDAIVNSAQ